MTREPLPPRPGPRGADAAPEPAPTRDARGDRGRALLASAFGLGLSPILPGTCAALLGLGFHALLAWTLPPWGVGVGLALGLGAACVLNQALTAFSVRRWGNEDPSQFVWDEIAGYLFTALLTVGLPWWPAAPLGFVLFRGLDMIKVWPASWIDRRWHGATGILLDDLVSAVYAAASVHLALRAGWIG